MSQTALKSDLNTESGVRNIPVFDLTDYDFSSDTVTAEKQRFADDLGRAFHTYGFVRLKNHGISDDILQKAEDASTAFFALDKEVKQKYSRPDIQFQTGFVVDAEVANGQTEADRKEYFMICAGKRADHMPETPDVPEVEGFKSSTDGLHEAFDGLIAKILRPLALHLELEETYFEGKTEEAHNMMRMLYYPSGGNASSHTDMSMLTILRAEKPGLYVTRRDGIEVEVVAEPGELILNGGKALGALTNNYFQPSYHRVDVKSDKPRYTIVYFAHLNPDELLDILPSDTLQNGDWGLKDENWFQRLSEFPLTYRQYSIERLAKNFAPRDNTQEPTANKP